MKDLILKLTALPPDKAKHFIAGSLAAAAGVGLVLAAGRGVPVFAPVAGVLAAAVAGLWKELRDERANEASLAEGLPAPHEVSGADVVATIAGSFPVVAPLVVAIVWRAVHG